MEAAQIMHTESILSERARRGVHGAFEALVLKYQARAYRIAWRMTGNESDAEEIVQEAFLGAHRAMGTFRGDSRFSTWLFRIVVNEALMRKRAAARRPLLSFDGDLRADEDGFVRADEGGGVEHLLDQKRLAQRVRDALNSLDDAQRAALVLRDLEGLSADEAGRILGVEPETVRQRAHRARNKMRALLMHLTPVVS